MQMYMRVKDMQDIHTGDGSRWRTFFFSVAASVVFELFTHVWCLCLLLVIKLFTSV